MIRDNFDNVAVTTDFTKTAVTGGYECAYTPKTALADGQHTISIEASDNDGNKASAKTLNRATGVILLILGVVVLGFSFLSK